MNNILFKLEYFFYRLFTVQLIIILLFVIVNGFRCFLMVFLCFLFISKSEYFGNLQVKEFSLEYLLFNFKRYFCFLFIQKIIMFVDIQNFFLNCNLYVFGRVLVINYVQLRGRRLLFMFLCVQVCVCFFVEVGVLGRIGFFGFF